MEPSIHPDPAGVFSGGPRSVERIPPKGRIDAFDALRSLLIVGVVVAHVSMTYMPYNLSWWYVTSEKTNLAFWVLMQVFNICVMPVLFFLAGYFTTGSYLKKGFSGFLVDKVKHIAIPWLLGIAIVNPLATLLSAEHPVERLATGLANNPLYLFLYQGHLWYLGILFLFFVGYALCARLVPPKGIRRSEPEWKSASLLAVCLVVSSAVACLSVTNIDDYYVWAIPFGSVIQFRPVKITTQICFFLLGIYGRRTKWFTEEGWAPRIGWWRISAIVSMIGYFILHLVIKAGNDPFLTTVLLPIADVVASYTSAMYILLAAIRYQKSVLIRRSAALSEYSYGVYWIHVVPMFFYLRAVNDLNVPIFFKWAVGIAFTCVASWLACKYILKKTPGLKRMF